MHELVSRHEDVGFISNLDDNLAFLNLQGSFNSLMFRSPLGKHTKKGRLRFAPSEAYKLIGKKVSPLYANSCRNLNASDVTPELKQSFRKFFFDRYRAQGKQVFVHKYTGWSRAEFFKAIFPEAKFVHIVRDGRAVANSFLQMDWWTGYRGPENWYLGPISEEYRLRWESSDRSFIVLAGIAWEILVTSVEQDASRIGHENVSTVRYEDFLGDPAGKIRSICDFCDLDFNDDAADRLSRSHIDPSRRQSFLTDLSSGQLEELTECIAGTLEKYGYSDVQ